MLSVVHDGPPQMPPDPFNLAVYALAQAEASPDKLALAIVTPTGASRWRYGALARAVRGIAGGLQSYGLAPGDRILMRIGNTVDFPLAYLGAIWAGFVPIPASAALTEREITQIATDTDPAVVISAPDVSLPNPNTAPVVTLSMLQEMQSGPEGLPDLGPADRPAYIVFTSGTSGRPRGVVHAHRALWARRMMWDGWYDLRPDDRVLHAGAFNWTYTLGTGLLDPWTRGATALIPGAGVAPHQLPLLMRRHDTTIFAAAPGVYRQMLRAIPKIDVPTMRHGLSAGERLPDAVRIQWQDATGCAVHEAYGMSECSTFVSGSPTRPAPSGTTGFPQPGRHVAVVDETGEPVPRGTSGTLAVHRSDPGMMLGYYGSAASAESTWFLTGDTVTMSIDGAITYLGRGDDMMNAGGFRVSPLEVEAALTEHPDINEVACVEVPVKADTTVIAAFYTAPAPLDSPALAAYASGRLARYKTPRLFEHRASLPRAGNGKLNRRALRAEWTLPSQADAKDQP